MPVNIGSKPDFKSEQKYATKAIALNPKIPQTESQTFKQVVQERMDKS